MKKLFFFAISFCFSLFLNAQVSKTATAGGLSSTLTATELSSVTNLTLTGTIDARDFKTMRDDMHLPAVLGFSGATIVGYSGTEGTSGISRYTYPANTVPYFAFYSPDSHLGKTSFTNVTFPLCLHIYSKSFGQ